ncbi:MAG: glycosyltransferase [Oculatellaceae cyanobacterium bins.114]|nr:glycosyltransferase [Oculatellaceae cyanobacterium bins.114]
MTLAVIIPVKNRVEITQCIASLMSIACVDRVVVCDGGSLEAHYLEPLNALTQPPHVEVLHLPIPGFNKSWLINQGIQHTQDEVLLISDADIVWNATTIEQLRAMVMTQPNTIACVHQVAESDPTAVSLRRDRYTYTIQTTATEAIVEVVAVPGQISDVKFSQRDHRPGCGLICAQRSTLLALGGYKELFQGWGWEDQDLLMRARLLGMSIQTVGSVLHLSHADTTRNQHWGQAEPSHTRDQNIVACVRSLAQGQLLGDLSGAIAPPHPIACSKSISVRLPATLLQKRFKT